MLGCLFSWGVLPLFFAPVSLLKELPLCRDQFVSALVVPCKKLVLHRRHQCFRNYSDATRCFLSCSPFDSSAGRLAGPCFRPEPPFNCSSCSFIFSS